MATPKKTKEQIAAEQCGMTIEEWRRAKQLATAAKGRGRRPAGTAGAETKLAGWGDVDGQAQLFACDEQVN
ncbi:hypothetical protein [Amycolatopsis sp. NPDC059657]|uniref:hypothetical protein n=1 Tax=Amycolatopsis sp. NPDC059657 TaxID=3346899 RepID=UPI00366F1421